MKLHAFIRETRLRAARASSLLLALTLFAGCKPSGPASTSTTSSGIATTAERAKFLHEYVTFRRTYETLDFDITYHNNTSVAPGPSDWDVRMVATVPSAELAAWIPPGVNPSPPPDAAWLKSVPTPLDLSGVNEWYTDGNRVIGLDRAHRIVVYRSSTN